MVLNIKYTFNSDLVGINTNCICEFFKDQGGIGNDHQYS